MNRVTVNMATRPFRNNTLVLSVLAAAIVATIGATVYNGYVYTNYGGRYHGLQAEERQHRDRLQELESEERELTREVAQRDFKRLKGRGQFAADLILKRAFSWTLLFNKLENVMPPDAMMTAIRPHISNDGIVIRVEGIAKNHGALISLEELLLKNPAFTKVYPASERRLNPSRPEITFVLQFDYLASKAVPGPEAVAAGAVPEGGPAPPGAAATPTPAPDAATAAASPAPAGTPGPPQAGAAPTPAVAQRSGSGSAPRSVIGTVGRDGRPRTSEIMAHLLLAPGGVYPDAPPPAPPEAAPTKKGRGKSRETKPATAPPGPAAAATPLPVAPAGPTTAGGASPATWQDGGRATPARPQAAQGLGLPRDPNRGPVAALRKPKPLAARPAEPIPATRLDETLSFSARPVGDVYAALSRAHGVRFDIDPTIDRRAPVSANLSGKNLKEAIAVLSKAAGHRVQRVEDGVYRVVPLAGGEPIGERPVQEESLPPGPVKP